MLKISEIFEKYNLHIQETDFSCGPCSIINVLKQLGEINYTEHDLIKLCDAYSGKGTDNNDIIDVIRKTGLRVIESNADATLSDIEKSIDLQYYVIVNYFHAYLGTGHYAVITEYDNKAFYFIDSESGFFRLDKKTFKKWWHNTDKTVYRWYVAIGKD